MFIIELLHIDFSRITVEIHLSEEKSVKLTAKYRILSKTCNNYSFVESTDNVFSSDEDEKTLYDFFDSAIYDYRNNDRIN